MNDQSSRMNRGEYQQHQRCNLCNVPIFQNPCNDERSGSVLNGKGTVLCNKCAAKLRAMPTEQANQALDNASKTYFNMAIKN